MRHVLISCTFMALMIWHALNRLVFITPKIKIYPFDGFRITGGIQVKTYTDLINLILQE
jgi:hypothetical protein